MPAFFHAWPGPPTHAPSGNLPHPQTPPAPTMPAEEERKHEALIQGLQQAAQQMQLSVSLEALREVEPVLAPLPPPQVGGRTLCCRPTCDGAAAAAAAIPQASVGEKPVKRLFIVSTLPCRRCRIRTTWMWMPATSTP